MTAAKSTKTKKTTLAGYVRLIVRSLESEGLDGQQLCEQAGINYDLLSDTESRFSQSNITRLWLGAVEASENEEIALKLAANVTADSLHLLGYSLMSSVDLLAGLKRFIRYQRAVGELFEMHLTNEGSSYILSMINRDNEPYVSQSTDAAMTVLVSFTRWLTQSSDTSPLKVLLSRSKPDDPGLYNDLFQCPVYFSQACNQMVYSETTLARKIPTAHQDLALLHDKLLGNYLDKINKLNITDLVEEKVINLLPSGLPKAEEVAAAMNMSSRTLHRRLKEVDLNFKTCLELTRKKLALAYINNPSLSLKETAFLLGFSEPSNFYRAFKRWYGMPPGQFNKKQ